MTKPKKKKKLKLTDVVKSAHEAGAKVSVSLAPIETDLEPLLQMTLDMDAIYHLAKSREIGSINAARMIARRIEYNAILHTLLNLEKEYWAKPILERP